MSFSLPLFTKVTVRSVNIRAENIGKEPRPAMDIGLRLVGSNRLLDMLDPGLRLAFYRQAGAVEGAQAELDGVDPLTDTPELRVTSVEMPIELIREYMGRDVVIDFGLGGKSNIELAVCDVNAFKANMKEGGTVEIDFRVQVSDVNEKAMGKLGGLVKHEVEITVMSSPEADGTQEKIPGPAQPQLTDGAPASPFRTSVAADGTVTTNGPPEAGDIFASKVAEGQAPELTPEQKRAAEKAARFPAAAAKKAAAKKKGRKA